MSPMTNAGQSSSSSSMYQYSGYPATLSNTDHSQTHQDNYGSTASGLTPLLLSPSQDRGSTNEKDELMPSSPSAHALALEKKKKNASAQAAFRARRSTYIANLEETVVSLENVIRRLQDACRDSHDDVVELREENVRLRGLVDGFKQRESIWKAYAKATAGVSVSASEIAAHHQPGGNMYIHTPESTTDSLPDGVNHPNLVYSNDPHFFTDPTLSYNYGQSDGESGQTGHHGFSTSNLQMFSGSLDIDPSSASSSKHSPTSSIPPTPTSTSLDVSYPSSHASLSLLPPTSSNAGGKSSFLPSYSMDTAAIQSQEFSTYQISSSMNGSHHRRTLSGPADTGNMDLSLYTTEDTSVTGAQLPVTNSPSMESSSLPHVPNTRSSSRSRRHTHHSSFPAPLSPPPRASAKVVKSSSAAVTAASSAASGMSNTLAVIKAQAFGNVRKTRTRAKKVGGSGEAAKAALEVLEARGLGLGLDIAGGVKRRRRGDYSSSHIGDDDE